VLWAILLTRSCRITSPARCLISAQWHWVHYRTDNSDRRFTCWRNYQGSDVTRRLLYAQQIDCVGNETSQRVPNADLFLARQLRCSLSRRRTTSEQYSQFARIHALGSSESFWESGSSYGSMIAAAIRYTAFNRGLRSYRAFLQCNVAGLIEWSFPHLIPLV